MAFQIRGKYGFLPLKPIIRYSPQYADWTFADDPLVCYIMDPTNVDELFRLKFLPKSEDLFTCSRLTVTLILQYEIIDIVNTDPFIFRYLHNIGRVEWDYLDREIIKKIISVTDIPDLVRLLTIGDIVEMHMSRLLNWPAYVLMTAGLPCGKVPKYTCEDLYRPLNEIKNLIYLPAPKEVVTFLLTRIFEETKEMTADLLAYMIRLHDLQRRNFKNADMILKTFPGQQINLLKRKLLYPEDLSDFTKVDLLNSRKVNSVDVLCSMNDVDYERHVGQFVEQKKLVEKMNFAKMISIEKFTLYESYADDGVWDGEVCIKLS